MTGLSSELAAELGQDLRLLVRMVEVPLVAVTTLSRRGSSTRGTAFRLQFADGRVLKGSLLESADQAREVEEVGGYLAHSGVPRVLSRAGAALLTQWVDGECLSGVDCTANVLRECGAFQGVVHNRPVPHARASGAEDVLVRWRERLRRHTDELVSSSVLEAGEARQTREIATQFSPPSCAVGYILGDFCAENIVRRDSGELCVVDIETLSIGPSDYDLGRTWYRWPMAPAQRIAYLNGYREHRDPSAFLAHFPYWGIHALVAGAVFRRRLGTDTVAVPLRRLRALIEDLQHGVAPEAAVFRS